MHSEIPSMDWDARGSEPSTPVPGLGALGQACPAAGTGAPVALSHQPKARLDFSSHTHSRILCPK